MSAKIADLKIGIKNQGESAVKDLQDLATALKTVDKAKKSLNFEDTVSKSNQGLRQLESTVQKLANIMKPLADQMEKISKGVGVLGARKNSASASASGKSGVASATEATNAIPEKLAGLDSTSIDTSRIGALSTTATEASSKLDILRQKLELLKQKYNELSAYPSKALEATNTAYQIKNLEATIKKLEEGEKASTGFGVGIKNIANSLRQVNISAGLSNTSIGKLVSSFGRLLKLKAMRMIVMQFYASIGEGIKNLYEYSRALGSVDSANFKTTMDGYSTSLQTLRNSIGAMIGQVLTAMLPTIQTLINYLTTAINVINQFFAALQGKAVFTKAKDSFKEYAESTSSSAGGASDAVKELQRTILAFDELNVLNSPDKSSGGGGGGGGASTPDYTDMFEEATISDKIKKIADKVKEVVNFIKENFDTIWAIVSNIGLALLAWKIATDVANFFGILDKLGFTKNAGKIAFGITLSLVGFAIEATGAFDIGKNGANLRNIIQTALGGAIGALGGVIAFGSTSLIATIPIAIAVAVSGFYLGEVSKALEENEDYQSALAFGKEIADMRGEISSILAEINSNDSLGEIATKVATAKTIADQIVDILGAENLTERQLTNLNTLIDQFNDLGISNIVLEYEDLAGNIDDARQKLDELIESYKKQAETEAYLELYKENFKGYIEEQVLYNKALEAQAQAEEELANWEKEHLDRYTQLRLEKEMGFGLTYNEAKEYKALNTELEQYKANVDNATSAVSEAKDAMNQTARDANYYWDAYAQSVGDATDTTIKRIGEVEHTWNELEFKEQRLDAVDGVTPKIDEINNNYGNAKDHIERSPAQLKAQNLVTSVANEAQRDWINKNFPAKGLTATNNVGTAVNEAYNTWTGKSFPSKGLSASTGAVTDSMNYVQRYWKNLDMSKGISATVTMGGARVQFSGYAEGGFPDYGTMFIAGENGAGAEMVGNINGRTGVASQGEITGIRQSVEATGNAEARLLAEQNALLRQILAKEGNVTVSTSAIIDGLNRTNRRAGKTVVAMGQ